MGETTKLVWQPLLAKVRQGLYESASPLGDDFMYCSERNTFISDPTILTEIRTARSHSKSFWLTGEWGTGKEAFIRLVARGNPGGKSIPCVSENINECTDNELHRFFGQGGVVDRSRDGLLCIDFLEKVVGWAPFCDRLQKLATFGLLERPDGQTVEHFNVRLIGNNTEPIEPLLARHPDSAFRWLYGELRQNQFVRMPLLRSRMRALEQILGELLAAAVLDTAYAINEAKVASIDQIGMQELTALRKHPWPTEFLGLRHTVIKALHCGSWRDAIARTVLGTTFVIWTRSQEEQAGRLCRLLRKADIPLFFSPESVEIGNWSSQTNDALAESLVVIVCITREAISTEREGYNLTELQTVIAKSSKSARITIVPVSLDGTLADDERINKGKLGRMLTELSDLQWYVVGVESGKGFDRLCKHLRRALEEVRRVQLQPRST